MKSQIFIFIAFSALLLNCKGSYRTANNSETEDSVTPIVDLRPVDLMVILCLYEEQENNWPTSEQELRTVNSFDSVNYYLKDFTNLGFLTISDTLRTSFQLRCSTTKFGNGTIKLNKLNDSTYFQINMEEVCGPGIRVANGSFCITCSSNYNDWNHLGELRRFIALNNE